MGFMTRLRGKWKGVVLYRIMEKTRRFNELRRLIPNITQRMLTLQLRQLEEAKLITRTVYPVIPPKVEYNLTELGQTLSPILIGLKTWGEDHLL